MGNRVIVAKPLNPNKLWAHEACLFCGHAEIDHPVSTGSGTCLTFRPMSGEQNVAALAELKANAFPSPPPA